FDGTHGRVRKLGDGALDFTKWFLRSKCRWMASFLGELEQAPEARDEAALRAATATVSAVSDVLTVGGGVLRAVAAWSASLTLLFILLRLAFDRYLSL